MLTEMLTPKTPFAQTDWLENSNVIDSKGLLGFVPQLLSANTPRQPFSDPDRELTGLLNSTPSVSRPDEMFDTNGINETVLHDDLANRSSGHGQFVVGIGRRIVHISIRSPQSEKPDRGYPPIQLVL